MKRRLLLHRLRRTPKCPVRKHINEVKVFKKSEDSQLNKILAQTLITLYGAFHKTKQNTISHPNIGSLKTAIEDGME